MTTAKEEATTLINAQAGPVPVDLYEAFEAKWKTTPDAALVETPKKESKE